jgi:proprotein convertase subtilisin/kexin type 5
VCKAGYYQNPADLSDTVCLTCISNCLTCSDSKTCDVCDTDNWYVLIPNKTCQYCGYGCDTCTNSKVCTACEVDYFNTTSKACIKDCADYYFENDANNQCDACAYACLECTSSTKCITCDTTKDHRELKDVSGVDTCICQERYYQPSTSTTVCSACISECLTCSSTTTC